MTPESLKTLNTLHIPDPAARDEIKGARLAALSAPLNFEIPIEVDGETFAVRASAFCSQRWNSAPDLAGFEVIVEFDFEHQNSGKAWVGRFRMYRSDLDDPDKVSPIAEARLAKGTGGFKSYSSYSDAGRVVRSSARKNTVAAAKAVREYVAARPWLKLAAYAVAVERHASENLDKAMRAMDDAAKRLNTYHDSEAEFLASMAELGEKDLPEVGAIFAALGEKGGGGIDEVFEAKEG